MKTIWIYALAVVMILATSIAMPAETTPTVKIIQATKSYLPETKNVPKAPAALTKAQLQAAIGQVRSNTGSTSTSASTSSATTEQITLTPREAVSGESFFRIEFGTSDPLLCYAALVLGQCNNGCFYFQFSTVGGKTYLLDFTIEGASNWRLTGSYNGTTQLQNGHVLVGFIASGNKTYIRLNPMDSGTNLFYKVTLTPVD